MVARDAIGIVVILAVLMISVLVYAPIEDQARQQVQALNDSQASSTFSSIANSGWGALQMYSIVPYIVVAVVILGMLIGLAVRT